MYIRTQEEALDAVAQILDLADRTEQIIQSTVRIMLCLEVEPRLFMADCQALLIQDGLEALRSRRREALEAMEDLPIVVVDPAEDRLFEEVASAIDALRLTEVVRQVFPELRYERWQIARALLLYESGIKEHVVSAIKGRADAAQRARSCEAIEGLVIALRPTWIDRAGAMRSACLDALKAVSGVEPDRFHESAEAVFELFAASDERATALLSAVDTDPVAAMSQIARIHEMAAAVRSIQIDPLGPSSGGGAREVA